MVWTCDRCGTTVEVPQEVVISEDYSPGAYEREPREWATGLPDWETYRDEESVSDVCQNCLTAGERADRLFREAAVDVLFGVDEEAA